MPITGIVVDLDTASDWWSPTRDAPFLGIYSKYGGREFRLNGGTSLNVQNQEITLLLGSGCCETEDAFQVQYSTGSGVNDPTLNPILLASVDFVYLRKETANSTSTNDDQYKLDGCKVLMCNDRGQLRRFEMYDNLNFSDEGGLQHWLTEGDPPGCLFRVTLEWIKHNDEARYPAGYDWLLDFDFTLAGTKHVVLNKEHVKVDRWDAPDEWERDFGKTKSIFIPGCCGQTYPLELHGRAEDQDKLGANDIGEEIHRLNVLCTNPRSQHDGTLEFIVRGLGHRRKSKIRMKYNVTAECMP